MLARAELARTGFKCVHGMKDGKRYAALGDAVTASVAEWIGRRIIAVDRERA
jgi:site-specific DNA-cytosine methylase